MGRGRISSRKALFTSLIVNYTQFPEGAVYAGAGEEGGVRDTRQPGHTLPAPDHTDSYVLFKHQKRN